MLTTYVEPKYFLMFVVWVLLHTPKIFRNSLPFVLLKKVVLVIAGNREEKVNGHSILIKVACCRNSDNSEKNLGLDSNSMQKKKICKRFYTWLQILAISMTFSNSKIKANYQKSWLYYKSQWKIWQFFKNALFNFIWQNGLI